MRESCAPRLACIGLLACVNILNFFLSSAAPPQKPASACCQSSTSWYDYPQRLARSCTSEICCFLTMNMICPAVAPAPAPPPKVPASPPPPGVHGYPLPDCLPWLLLGTSEMQTCNNLGLACRHSAEQPSTAASDPRCCPCVWYSRDLCSMNFIMFAASLQCWYLTWDTATQSPPPAVPSTPC